jgi:hypothetical protein
MAVSGKGPAPREVPFALLTDIPDQEADGLALATKLAKFANFSQGTIAARPAVGASQEGDIYWAKNDTTYGPTGSWWIVFGGKWELFPLPNVVTAMLANLAVTTAKLAEESVTSAKIAAGAITSPKLGILTEALLPRLGVAFGSTLSYGRMNIISAGVGAVHLPTPTSESVVGFYNLGAAGTVVTIEMSGAGKIFGYWEKELLNGTSVVLNPGQHIVLCGDGVNWLPIG